jgi:hypothetical protein
MRNIDGSQWLRNPELEVVETSKSGPGSSFTLSADQVTTSSDDAGPRAGAKIRKASLGGAGVRQ